MTARQQARQAWCDRVQWALVALLLAVSGGLYTLGLRPAMNQLAEITHRAQDEEAELTGNTARAGNLPMVQRQVAALKQKVEGIKRVPTNPDLPRFISDVTNISQQASLHRPVWKNDLQPRRCDLFAELPIQFTFEGDYSGVYEFFRKVEDLPRLTRVRKLDIRGKDPKTGQVQVQLTMNVYFAEE